jgi:hypothetical protein
MTIVVRAYQAWFAAHPEAREGDGKLECIKANAKIRLPQALAEARQAIEIGMVQVAEKTFAATMALAGIDAAKENAVLA